MAPPIPVKFFHFAGDLQKACRLGKIKAGDVVMFNAGSLLTWRALARSKVKMASYAVMDEVDYISSVDYRNLNYFNIFLIFIYS